MANPHPFVRRRLLLEGLENRQCLATGFVLQTLDGLPSQPYAYAVTLGDLDGDRDQDLILGIQSWRENLDGTGQFGEPHPIAADGNFEGYYSKGLAVDLDGDGDYDLVASVDKSIVWLENRDGRGRFGSQQTLVTETGSGTIQCRVADFDGDNVLDLVVSLNDFSGNYPLKTYRRSATDKPFELNRSFSVSRGSHFDITDWDADGDQDLLTSDGVRYNLDRGNAWSVATGPAPGENFILSDLEGDGTPDVITQQLRRIQPSSTEAARLTIEAFESLRLLDVQDLDGDRDGDLILEAGSLEAARTAVSINSGNRFGALINLPYDYETMGDVNGDRIAEGVNSFDVWKYDAINRSFSSLHPRAERLENGGMTIDIDGDSDEDLIFWQGSICRRFPDTFCNVQVRWSENQDGRGTFGASRLIRTLGDMAPRSISEITHRFLDVDDDGDLDYLTTVFEQLKQELAWVENTDSRGTFSPSFHRLGAPGEYATARTMDVDQDGDMDLVSAEKWLENLPGPNFAPAASLIQPESIQAIDWGDWDADGDLDLFVLPDRQNVRSVPLLYFERLNVRPPSFANAVNLGDIEKPFDNYGVNLSLFDADGDGDSDVLIHALQAHVYLRRNIAGNLGTKEPLISTGNWQLVDIADLDGDQDMDLVAHTNEPHWFENIDGAGTFAERSLSPGITYHVWVSDFDGDGDQDLLSNGSYWHENRPLGDVNDDGRFDSSDLVELFATGLFEYDVQGIATFETGDWNGDGSFDTADLVFALQAGRYVE